MDGDNLLVFNGINGATGDYLLPPVSQRTLGQAALGTRWQEAEFRELEARHAQHSEKRYALRAGLDAQDLAQAGWGVIFPAAWEEGVQQAVRAALWELLEWRQAQAGPLYREFLGPDAPTRGESKDAFLRRFGAGPGLVDPTNVPYYLLIVGDPASIPYRFQFELSVAYAVGRLDLPTLEDYARYARSVLTAERGVEGQPVRLARKAAFFGPANPKDKATHLSANLLVKPLAEYIEREFKDWQVSYVPPQESTKDRLKRLLGGAETPALLFTASHGLGYPLGDDRQKLYQGALLCQDWPGPSTLPGHEMFFAGDDLDSSSGLLGLVAFHFACFGAGTPQREFFGVPGVKPATSIARRDFTSALPQRLLAHPRGGALAVVGHVDRAWSFSFQWGEQDSQTVTFESMLYKLLKGQTVGSALEDLSLRYAELATLLSGKIYDAEISKPNLMEMARLWTAHNDARGYALLGDPAVRLPLAGQGESAERLAIPEVTSPQGALPEPALEAAAQPEAASQAAEELTAAGKYTVAAGPAAAETALPAEESAALKRDLQAAVKALSGLSMLTYLLPGGEPFHTPDWQADPPPGARPVALTRLEGGKARTVLLETGLDPALLAAHSAYVETTFAALQRTLDAAAKLLGE
jgi:hypothetical protein